MRRKRLETLWMTPWRSSLATIVFVAHASSAVLAADAVEFQRDIRPILSGNCFACHGPDDESREADLRLDLENEAFGDLGGYRAIVAGNPEASELFRRIDAKDADERMPPPKSGKSLTPEQIALIRRWIEEGAAWQSHWSFVAPRRPEPPQVEPEDRVDR